MIEKFLAKLTMTTKAFYSTDNCLVFILPGMYFALHHFEAGKAAHHDGSFPSPMFNSGWSKFDKYYPH